MTTHDELREAVAKALAPTLYGGVEYRLTRVDLRRADAALAAVRAALEMPSGAMLREADRAMGNDPEKATLADIPRVARLDAAYRAAMAASPLAEPVARDEGEG